MGARWWIMAACPAPSRRFGCSTPFTAARITSRVARKRESGRLLDIYTDHGGTKEETEKLITSYKQSGASFFAAEDMAASADALRTKQTGSSSIRTWPTTMCQSSVRPSPVSQIKAAWKTNEHQHRRAHLNVGQTRISPSASTYLWRTSAGERRFPSP